MSATFNRASKNTLMKIPMKKMKKWKNWQGGGTFGVLLPLFLVLLTGAVVTAQASEQDALFISTNIQNLHLPHGTIIDPLFTSPYSTLISRYTRGGDSALWTGHYLAAEAFRFGGSGSSAALANVRKALSGIRALVDVTGTNLLARCLVPVDWENNFDKKGIITEEAGHGIYTGALGGKAYYFLGNTSRDQYSGIFFGLGVAYDLIPDSIDPNMR